MLDTHNSLKCHENVKCNLITLKILCKIRKSIQNRKILLLSFPFYIPRSYIPSNPINIIIIVSFTALDSKNQGKLGNPSQYDDKYGLCW